MTAHTAGPWAIAAGKTFCAIRTDDRVIADMRHVGQHYNKADALLIAAAPDILQALQKLIEAPSHGTHEAIRRAHEAARAAINKATQEPAA